MTTTRKPPVWSPLWVEELARLHAAEAEADRLRAELTRVQGLAVTLLDAADERLAREAEERRILLDVVTRLNDENALLKRQGT